MLVLTTILLFLTVAVPTAVYLKSERGLQSKKIALFSNIGMFFASLVIITICMFSGSALAAGEAAAEAASSAAGLGYIAAGLTTGASTIGAGVAVGAAASAALGALSENEKVFGKALIFVALAEGIALYGVLVSVLILGNIG